jgi:hypothetical protein
VSTYQENMPPVARFEVIPFVDEVRQGEEIRLDASSSYDPENMPLAYRWYSDIERYPLVSLLGNESAIDIALNTTGVQRIWLEVSDGKVTVRSEEVRIRVLPARSSSDGEGTGSSQDTIDLLPFILLALVLGIFVGVIGSYLILRRKEQKVVLPPPVLEEAKMEVDYHPINCPYCKAEVRTTDTYCMKCATVFTASDIEAMRSDAMGARPSKKRSRIELQQPSDESILPPSMDGEPMFLEGDEGIEDENPEDEVEFEDISEIEEDDEEDEDWEVRP